MNSIHFLILSYCRSRIAVSPYIRYMVHGTMTAASAHAEAE